MSYVCQTKNSCIKLPFFMRKFFVSITLFSVIVLLLSSCTQTATTNPNVIPTKMTISLSKTTVIADGVDKAEVTVKDQAGNDISATSIIVVDGAAIVGTGVSFESNQIGTYQVFASKFGIISDTLNITSVAPPAAKYSTKVLAEHYTGAWCGWCPRMVHKVNNFVQNNNKIIPVRFHNNDGLSSGSIDSALRARFNITAVPNVVINRTSIFQENGDVNNLADSVEFRRFLQKRSVLGLALNTTISGNNLNVTARVGFDATISDSLKLIVLLTESGLVLPQTNYYSNKANYPGTPFFSSGNPISNFINQFVFRRSPTTAFGVTIPVSSQTKNGEHTANYIVDITGYNPANLRVVAFVVYAENQPKTGLLNVQTVAAGGTQAYD